MNSYSSHIHRQSEKKFWAKEELVGNHYCTPAFVAKQQTQNILASVGHFTSNTLNKVLLKSTMIFYLL